MCPSQIDPDFPTFGEATTESVRANFEHARNEITVLQQSAEGAPFLSLSGGTMDADATIVLGRDPEEAMEPVTLRFAQQHYTPAEAGISDAPQNGHLFARRDGTWTGIDTIIAAGLRAASSVMIPFAFVGAYASSAEINMPIAFPLTIPEDWDGSVAYRPGTNTTARAFTMSRVRGSTTTTVGTINVTTGAGGTATFDTSAEVELEAGDILRLTAPAAADATLNNFAVTVLAYRVIETPEADEPEEC